MLILPTVSQKINVYTIEIQKIRIVINESICFMITLPPHIHIQPIHTRKKKRERDCDNDDDDEEFESLPIASHFINLFGGHGTI